MVDVFPLILGLLILIASLISIKWGISVTIIEIILGVVAGNLGIIRPEQWMVYIASFGGVLLTFLAGTEVDVKLLKNKFKESFLIGLGSFIAPFLGVFLLAYYCIGWNLLESLLTATALSETSISVVYSVLTEKGLFKYDLGKLIMVATFIGNLLTAIVLSLLFMKTDINTVIFYSASAIIIYLAYKYSNKIFYSKLLRNKLAEVEIKYIFLLLLGFIFLGSLGGGQAILPAFILGVVLSSYFKVEDKGEVKSRIKTVAFAVITPIFFIVGGMKVSIALILSSIIIFVVIFAVRQIAKFIGVYSISKYYLKDSYEYVTLMMSTGLTFGLVAAVFGLNNGVISQTVYSVLTGVLVLSAVLPTFVAEKWYSPVHSEDINEL
ncbi:potassium transporter [Methanobrevibacter sp. 87.7]|uniref:cation:proton antiporter n=1 Tax=Methanobrevibacter sp. 87.7 TaxID=387957 RepID=UPI000B50B7B9|nr:cation:proton antiporter [Methanobrevibacter sp. 87.7]OWT33772.1 potassium transporter [Methanobrevibacter sp. 87.7]